MTNTTSTDLCIKDNGGPAFPETCGDQIVPGMTLRDYFAAKAMQIIWDAYDKGYCGLTNHDTPNSEVIAEGAYQLADAMLAERG